MIYIDRCPVCQRVEAGDGIANYDCSYCESHGVDARMESFVVIDKIVKIKEVKMDMVHPLPPGPFREKYKMFTLTAIMST